MATTTYEATITQGSRTVKILLLGQKCVKHQINKNATIIPIPKQSPPKTWVVDLIMLREYITIQGVLLDESGSSARKKKEDLIDIIHTAGTMNLTWDVDSNNNTKNYTVNVVKAEIAESAGSIGDEEDTKYYDINIQFIIGEHKG